jgi:Tfp pilus assembly protein PilF
MSTVEQAQIYMAQGQTCQAVAMCRKAIKTDPSVENLTMLAELYMRQGLHEDSIELHLRIVKMGLQ